MNSEILFVLMGTILVFPLVERTVVFMFAVVSLVVESLRRIGS